MKEQDKYWQSVAKLPLEDFQVAGGLDPSKWATSQPLKDAAKKLGLDKCFLQEVADLCLVPHFRFQNSIRFAMQPLRQWIGENCIQVVNGKWLPEFEVFTIHVERPPKKDIPAELRGVRNLTKATPTCRWPGIYFLVNGDEVVYVGQSQNVASRCGQHNDKTFTSAFAVPCHSKALLQVEREYIKSFLPQYNNCSMSLKWKKDSQKTAITEKEAI